MNDVLGDLKLMLPSDAVSNTSSIYRIAESGFRGPPSTEHIGFQLDVRGKGGFTGTMG